MWLSKIRFLITTGKLLRHVANGAILKTPRSKEFCKLPPAVDRPQPKMSTFSARSHSLKSRAIEVIVGVNSIGVRVLSSAMSFAFVSDCNRNCYRIIFGSSESFTNIKQRVGENIAQAVSNCRRD